MFPDKKCNVMVNCKIIFCRKYWHRLNVQRCRRWLPPAINVAAEGSSWFWQIHRERNQFWDGQCIYKGKRIIAQCVLCSLRCPCILYNPVSYTIKRMGGYRGIFREEEVDTGAYLRGNHGSRVWKSQKCEKMYFPHTRTSWGKSMFHVIPNSNFKIGLSLFGCAEKYTEQSTHCALVLGCKF